MILTFLLCTLLGTIADAHEVFRTEVRQSYECLDNRFPDLFFDQAGRTWCSSWSGDFVPAVLVGREVTVRVPHQHQSVNHVNVHYHRGQVQGSVGWTDRNGSYVGLQVGVPLPRPRPSVQSAHVHRRINGVLCHNKPRPVRKPTQARHSGNCSCGSCSTRHKTTSASHRPHR